MSRYTESHLVRGCTVARPHARKKLIGRHRAATALAGGVLAVLSFADPASAQQTQGGAGGGQTPSPGGSSVSTGPGGNGGNATVAFAGGGGGGAGETGGNGGSGNKANGSAGGGAPGGATAGASGADGTDDPGIGGAGGGGGGGGGGAHGGRANSAPGGPVTGGNGGAGGDAATGDGGGGGAGGYGFVYTGTGPVTFSSSITGGQGGQGGIGAFGGTGGGGGHGLVFTSGGPLVATISGAVTGGNGGAAGVSYTPFPALNGSPGAGGAGIIGSNLTLNLNAAVSGGLSGDGATRAQSLYFSSGVNKVTLGSGWGLTGGITIAAGSLELNTASTDTLGNVTSGGGSIIKAGAGALILTATNTYTGGTTITGGSIVFSALNNLGTGNITLDGGALDWADGNNADISARLNAIGSGGATFATRGNNITFASGLSGTGGIIKIDGGTLTLAGTNSYSGTTAIFGGTLQIGNGGTSGTLATGAVSVGTFGTLAFNRSDTITVANTIGGAGKLTQAGTGTTILTGSNTYTGITTISAGTLQIGDGGPSGTLGTGNVIDNSRLVFNRSGTLTVGNNVSGTGSVTQAGSGTTILTGSNSYSGGTIVNAGTLQINSVGAFGTGPLALNGGNFRADASGTITGGFSSDVNTTSTFSVAAGKSLTLQTAANALGGVEGTIHFGTATDTGTLEIVTTNFGANNLPTFFIDGGTLRLTGANVGLITGYAEKIEVADIATFDLGGTNFTGSAFAIRDLQGTGTLINDGGQAGIASGNFGGTITGSTGLIKQGNLFGSPTDVLILTGANTYTGGTTITSGLLQIGNAGALGSGRVTFNGGSLRSTVTGTLNNELRWNPNQISSLFSAATGTTLTLTGNVNATNVGVPTYLRFGSATDTGTIVFDPAGSIGIAVNAQGALSVEGGTLRSGTGILGRSGLPFLMNAFAVTRIDAGATLDLTGSQFDFGFKIKNLEGEGFLINDGTVRIAAGDFAGNITAPGIEKTGTGTLILSGTDVAGGGFVQQINLNEGTLLINGAIGDVDGNSATLFLGNAGGATRFGGSGTFYGNVFGLNGPATVAPGNSPGTLSIAGNLSLGTSDIVEFELGEAGVVGGPNNDLIIVGGHLTLSGPTLDIVSLGGGAGYYRLFNYGTLAGGSNFVAINTPGGYTATALFGVPGQINLRVSDGVTAFTQYWDGEDTIGATVADGGAGGSGVWNSALTNWTAAPDYAINDSWQSGNAVFAGAFGGIVTVEGTQSVTGLRFESDFYSLEAGAGGQLSLGAGATIDVSAGISATLALPLISGDGLRKTGDGTLVLTGVSSLSGDTSITGGLINFADLGAFDTGNIILDGGGLQWADGNTIDVSARLSPIGAGGGTFDTNGNDVTLAGVISGSGGITKAGPGTLFLTADNTYAGGTTFGGGTISISNLGALGSGDLFFDGGILQTKADLDITAPVHLLTFGTFDTVDGTSLIVSSDIDGPGGLVKFGGGTLTLTGFNGYSGPTIIQGGTLEAGDFFSLGSSGEVEIDSGARLRALSDIFVANIDILEGGGRIDTGDNFVDVFGTIDFLGRLTKEGSGTLLIEDFLGFGGSGGGGIDVLGGTLGLGSDFAAGFGNIFLADGTTLLNAACGCGFLEIDNEIQVEIGGTATFDGGGGYFVLNGTISGGNASFVSPPSDQEPTASIFELTGVNSYGDTLIGPNVALILSGAGTLGTGNTVFDPAPSDPFTPAALVFQNSSDYSYAGIISGAGIVSVEADDEVTITLSGSNTSALNFTGFVDVLSGNLIIDGAFGDVVDNSASLFISGCGCSMPTLGGSGTFHGDVTVGDAILSPGSSPGTLTIGGDLILTAGTVLNYELGEPGTVGGPNNDLINVGGNLTLDGTLNVSAFGAGYGPGYYRLLNYGGSLTDNGLDIGSIDGSLPATILTNINGQINLRLGTPTIQYWDGADLTGSSNAVTGDGGSGFWTASNTNWTTPTGYAVNDVWQGATGVFQGAAGGTVTVEGSLSFQELDFRTDGYLLRPLNITSRLNTTGSFSIIDVAGGLTADIGVVIDGAAGLTKTGDGTLILGGENTYSGGTTLAGGRLRLLNDDAAGSGTITITGSVLSYGQGVTIANSIILNSNTTQLEVLTGEFATQAGVISQTGGARPIEKIGGGILTLTAVNTYTGLTTVSEGTLEVAATGSLAGAVQNNATFTNAGAVAGLVTNAGTLNSTGILNGGLVNTSSANLRGQVNGAVANSGTITLTGTTTGIGVYTGQISSSFNLGGFDTSIGSLAGDGLIAVGSGTLTTGSNNLDTRFDGVIAGSTGGLTKVGTGTLELSGEISYFGSTLIAGGTLRTLNDGVFAGFPSDVDVAVGATFDLNGTAQQIGGLSGGGSVTIGDGLLLAGVGGDTTTFSGSLSGTGDFRKLGTGTLTLNGTSTIGGLEVVTNSFLAIGSAGSVTADFVLVEGSLNNAGTLAGTVSVLDAGSLTSTGIITGPLTNRGTSSISGQLNGAVDNFGTLTLTGTTTGIGAYTGHEFASFDLADFDTVIGSLAGEGEVQLGSASLTAGGDNSSTSFTGQIHGTGSLIKTGTGTLTLDNFFNSYSGGTFLNAGTLAIRGAPLGTGDLIMANGTTLALVGNSSNQTNIQLGSLGSRIDTAGFSLTLEGIVSGGALTKIGSGTLLLQGVNTYTGLTTVSGGTLTIASFASIVGNVFNQATFENFGTVGGIVDNRGTATNHGIINGAVLNSGTLTSDGTLAGGLNNSGTAFLSSEVGVGIVNSGSITLTGDLLPVPFLTQSAAGSLNLAGFSADFGTFSGAGSVSLGADGLLSVGSSNVNSQFDGIISGGGSLIKDGTGRFVLTGTNTYTGSTGIFAGTLQLGTGGTTGSIVGAISNDGILVVNRSNALTLGGAISGTGMFVQAGTGTTTLTAANSYSGGTLISAGRLVGNSASLQGDIQNDSALEFAQSFNGTFAGRLFGAGLLEKTGVGLLTFSGNSSAFTGPTFILGGTLNVTGSLANSAITIGNGATLAGTGVVGSFVAQSGSTVAPGSAAPAATAAMAGLAPAASGKDGNLRPAPMQESAFADAVADPIVAGGQKPRGSASPTPMLAEGGSAGRSLGLVAPQRAPFGGPQSLRLAASLDGDFALDGSFVGMSGGLIAPTARGQDLALAAASVDPSAAPPFAIGALMVNGNATFQAGSTFATDITLAGADLLLATGTAQLAGTLQLTSDNSRYAFDSVYLLLQANGGRFGTFDTTNLLGFAAAYVPEIVYTGTQVLVRLRANQLSNIVGATNLTFNQASTMQRIDTAVAAGFNPQGLIDLFFLPAAQLGTGFDALSGEAYATTTRVMLEDRLVREATLNRLVELQRADGRSGWGAWGHGFRSWGSGDSDGNASDFDREQDGLVFGLDYVAPLENGSVQLGIQGHFTTTDVSVDSLGSRAEVERAGAGIHAGATFGSFALRAGATYSRLEGDVSRQVTFTGFNQSTTGQLDGEMIQAFGEIAYTLPLSSRVTLEPFVNVAITQVDFDPLVETGGAAALSVNGQSFDLGLATFGVRGRARVGGEGTRLSLDGSLGLRTSFGDRGTDPIIALAAAPQQAFEIRSAIVDDVALAAELDARLDISDSVSLTVGYSGVIGANGRDHAARAGISLRF